MGKGLSIVTLPALARNDLGNIGEGFRIPFYHLVASNVRRLLLRSSACTS
jgi:hypothetical protein